MTATNEYLSTPEVAALLGRSARTVHRMVAAGTLVPAFTAPGGPHGAYLFDRAYIERFRAADSAA